MTQVYGFFYEMHCRREGVLSWIKLFKLHLLTFQLLFLFNSSGL